VLAVHWRRAFHAEVIALDLAMELLKTMVCVTEHASFSGRTWQQLTGGKGIDSSLRLKNPLIE